MTDGVRRQALADGSIRLSTEGCSFLFRRPGPGALVVTIEGYDKGLFGTATLDEITAAIARDRPLELFIDARKAVGAAVSVSDEWTRFLSVRRESLSRVHVLVSSKVVHLTVAIAQHLSRTGKLIQIHSDPEIFLSLLAHRLA